MSHKKIVIEHLQVLIKKVDASVQMGTEAYSKIRSLKLTSVKDGTLHSTILSMLEELLALEKKLMLKHG